MVLGSGRNSWDDECSGYSVDVSVTNVVLQLLMCQELIANNWIK